MAHSLELSANDLRRCASCLRWRPEAVFGRDARKPDGLARKCRPCIAQRQRERNWLAGKNQPRTGGAQRDENGNKRCTLCRLWFAEDSFGSDAARLDGLMNTCRPCTNRKSRNQDRANRLRRGPVVRPRPSLARDEGGNKQCHRCARWAPEAEFGRNVASRDGLMHMCRVCVVASQHSTTREELDALLAAQDGSCAACGDDLAEGYHVDHDHSCCAAAASCGSCIRGLLCKSCNVGLGFFRDDVTRLLKAADYLALARNAREVAHASTT
jgi:hypothetical protein